MHVQVVLPAGTRTETWKRPGTDIASLPPEIVMDVREMVDAALLALDRGETVAIPALEAIEHQKKPPRAAIGHKHSTRPPRTPTYQS